MDTNGRPKRLYLLWFVAAALAFTAVAIELIRVQTFDWTGAIMGGICVLMGLVGRRRKPQDVPKA